VGPNGQRYLPYFASGCIIHTMEQGQRMEFLPTDRSSFDLNSAGSFEWRTFEHPTQANQMFDPNIINPSLTFALKFADGKIAALSSIFDYDQKNGNCQVAVASNVAPGEIFLPLLRHCFGVLNLEKVGVKLIENSKIISDLEKIGFVVEAKMRRHAFSNGKYMDVVWMAIVRDDFKRCNNEL